MIASQAYLEQAVFEMLIYSMEHMQCKYNAYAYLNAYCLHVYSRKLHGAQMH